mmetsp:Transcript_4621/g.5346  ORF Transcript_4621/g.5346 Transcript_4621/m.5346 type:complete len:85 (-) Transcript_4621:33-287(-)
MNVDSMIELPQDREARIKQAEALKSDSAIYHSLPKGAIDYGHNDENSGLQAGLAELRTHPSGSTGHDQQISTWSGTFREHAHLP